jgi:hypothetical protein
MPNDRAERGADAQQLVGRGEAPGDLFSARRLVRFRA